MRWHQGRGFLHHAEVFPRQQPSLQAAGQDTKEAPRGKAAEEEAAQ